MSFSEILPVHDELDFDFYENRVEIRAVSPDGHRTTHTFLFPRRFDLVHRLEREFGEGPVTYHCIEASMDLLKFDEEDFRQINALSRMWNIQKPHPGNYRLTFEMVTKGLCVEMKDKNVPYGPALRPGAVAFNIGMIPRW